MTCTLDHTVMRNHEVMESREMSEFSWQMCPQLALHVQTLIETHLSNGASRKLLQSNTTTALARPTQRSAQDLPDLCILVAVFGGCTT